MTESELVTIILLVCGKGFSDEAQECREKIVNCVVGRRGEIEPKKVEECLVKLKESAK